MPRGCRPVCRTGRADVELDSARRTSARRPTATAQDDCRAWCGAWPARAGCDARASCAGWWPRHSRGRRARRPVGIRAWRDRWDSALSACRHSPRALSNYRRWRVTNQCRPRARANLGARMNQIPDAFLLPVAQTPPTGHARPAAQFLRQHSPGNPAAQNKEDAGEACTIRDSRPATVRSRRWNRQKRCDKIPQRVGQQHGGHKPRTLSCRTERVYAGHRARFVTRSKALRQPERAEMP
jgi:hypothetical protein